MWRIYITTIHFALIDRAKYKLKFYFILSFRNKEGKRNWERPLKFNMHKVLYSLRFRFVHVLDFTFRFNKIFIEILVFFLRKKSLWDYFQIVFFTKIPMILFQKLNFIASAFAMKNNFPGEIWILHLLFSIHSILYQWSIIIHIFSVS